jgi:hypothetical protein
MYCIAYIQSAIDTFAYTDEIMLRTLKDRVFLCIPVGVPPKVTEDIVRRYLTDHPDKLRYDAISEIGAALSEAYPCPK